MHFGFLRAKVNMISQYQNWESVAKVLACEDEGMGNIPAAMMPDVLRTAQTNLAEDVLIKLCKSIPLAPPKSTGSLADERQAAVQFCTAATGSAGADAGGASPRMVGDEAFFSAAKGTKAILDCWSSDPRQIQ
eukprot:848231-Pyramimonas_sp.AAC.1